METDKLKSFHFLQDSKKGVSLVQIRSPRKRVSTAEYPSLTQKKAPEDELAKEIFFQYRQKVGQRQVEQIGAVPQILKIEIVQEIVQLPKGQQQ